METFYFGRQKEKKMKDWRKTREYRIWKAHVVRRDKVCKICGAIKSRQAHHINHATYFPELRFEDSNGICLCYKCHMNYHCNFHRSYREKCTEYTLNNFKTLVNYFRTILGANNE
jgi:hypothetical protein